MVWTIVKSLNFLVEISFATLFLKLVVTKKNTHMRKHNKHVRTLCVRIIRTRYFSFEPLVTTKKITPDKNTTVKFVLIPPPSPPHKSSPSLVKGRIQNLNYLIFQNSPTKDDFCSVALPPPPGKQPKKMKRGGVLRTNSTVIVKVPITELVGNLRHEWGGG